MIKLINGETIVGEEVAVTEDDIILDHPLILQTTSNDQGDEGLILTRYVYLTEDTSLSFKQKHVIMKTKVNSLMTQYFLLSNDMLYFTDKNLERSIRETNNNLENVISQLDVDDDSLRDLASMEPLSKLPS